MLNWPILWIPSAPVQLNSRRFIVTTPGDAFDDLSKTHSRKILLFYYCCRRLPNCRTRQGLRPWVMDGQPVFMTCPIDVCCPRTGVRNSSETALKRRLEHEPIEIWKKNKVIKIPTELNIRVSECSSSHLTASLDIYHLSRSPRSISDSLQGVLFIGCPGFRGLSGHGYVALYVPRTGVSWPEGQYWPRQGQPSVLVCCWFVFKYAAIVACRRRCVDSHHSIITFSILSCISASRSA